MIGRFAPSPTGPLHLGNLRTAAIAWLSARSRGGRFIVRVEDLDRLQSSDENERRQLDDLRSIGLDWDGDVVRQSDRFDRYSAAIDALAERGSVYECYCTRREILDAPTAPHGPPGTYPGTCRDLSDGERARRRRERPPALRLRANNELVEFVDLVRGVTVGLVDDVVIRRNDGVPAYNLAVVVDDGAQAVTEVLRGDDLLMSTPRQIHLQRLLGLPTPTYAHVPLVVGDDGERLAKRHGAVTLGELSALGVGPDAVVRWITGSLDIGPSDTLRSAVAAFDLDRLPRSTCRVPATFGQ